MNYFLFALALLIALKSVLVYIAWRDRVRRVLIGTWVRRVPPPYGLVQSVEFTDELCRVTEPGEKWCFLEYRLGPSDFLRTTRARYEKLHNIITIRAPDVGIDTTMEFEAFRTLFVKLKNPIKMKNLFKSFWLCLLVFFTACESSELVAPDPGIVGEWRWVDPQNESSVSVMKFATDGTVTVFYVQKNGAIAPVGTFDYFVQGAVIAILPQTGAADAYAQKAVMKPEGLYIGGRIYKRS